MKTLSKIELKLENFEKCHMIIDADCPLGQLYDYACSLKHFIWQKIKEVENQEKQLEDEQKAV
jgi:hypothetical protein